MNTLLLFIAGFIAAVSGHTPIVSPIVNVIVSPPTVSPTTQQLHVHISTGTVTKISGASTIEVSVDGKLEAISLIGISDISKNDTYVTCQYSSLNESLLTLLAGKKVYLADDESINDRDEFARMNRYVMLEDATMVNEILLKEGLALHRQPDTSPYSDAFESLEKKAQEHHIGIWDTRCIASPTPTISPTLALTPTHIPILPPRTLSVKPSTIIATKTPTQTPTPMHLILSTVTPSITPQPFIHISTTPAPTSISSLNADVLFTLINLFRKTKNLEPFKKDDQLCRLAQSRAPELPQEIATGSIHTGFYDRHIPYWITENMAQYDSEDIIMNFWLNSRIHRAAIEGNFIYSCGACDGKSCTQLFTSFVPK